MKLRKPKQELIKMETKTTEEETGDETKEN